MKTSNKINIDNLPLELRIKMDRYIATIRRTQREIIDAALFNSADYAFLVMKEADAERHEDHQTVIDLVTKINDENEAAGIPKIYDGPRGDGRAIQEWCYSVMGINENDMVVM